MRLIFFFHLVILYQLSTTFSTNFGNDYLKDIFFCINIFFSGRYDLSAIESDDGIARFLVVGDWGGLPFLPYETPSEVAVADAMGKLGAKLNTSFQLALGDNFYFDGVSSAHDSRFEVNYIFLEEARSLHINSFSIHLNMYSKRHHYKHHGMF
jgi:hypothetical protein